LNSGSKDHQDKYRIKVLQKTFAVLDLFSGEDDELSPPEITKRLGFTQTTVFRIITNLADAGYLQKNLETGKFRLGMKLFLLGNRVKPYHHLSSAARPLLRTLSKKTGETVHLAVLQRYQVLYLDKIEGSHTVRVVVSQVGQKLPAHCSGVGKALLANLPLNKVKEATEEHGLPSFTPNTITTWNRLKIELEETQARGYAVDNEEIELGLKCVAAPLFVEEKIVAAISISSPKERFEKSEKELISLVVQTAREISNTLQETVASLTSTAA